MTRASQRGILLAVAAYVAWGFLSPVGQRLLESMGPFTLNAIRTLASLPLLMALFGRQTTREALHLLKTRDAWILGGIWLPLTFVPYLWSLKYLPPTITTLSVYLTPLLVAGWLRLRHHRSISPMVLVAVAAAFGGGYAAVSGPGGVPLNHAGLVGVVLAVVGVLGWSAYTIHLKQLTLAHSANVLTLAAFLASTIPFLAGAAWEGFRITWTPVTATHLGLYVLLPSVVSFWLYAQSLERTDATLVAVLLGVELGATVVVSYFFTQEEFTWIKLGGLAIVGLGITAYLWDEHRRTHQKRVLPQD